MKLSSPGFSDDQPIPGGNAFCVPDPENHVSSRGKPQPGLVLE